MAPNNKRMSSKNNRPKIENKTPVKINKVNAFPSICSAFFMFFFPRFIDMRAPPPIPIKSPVANIKVKSGKEILIPAIAKRPTPKLMNIRSTMLYNT